jgi:hypothetical protein
MDDLQREMQQIEKRTRAYWFDDGLAEIASGAAFLLVALDLLLTQTLKGRASARLLNNVLPILVILVVFGTRRVIRAAKDRYVHPRTGYVSFARPHANRWANAVLGAVIAALVAFGASRVRAFDEWISAFIGGVLGGAFFVLGRQAGTLRFPIEGLSCVVLGVSLSLLRVNQDLAAAAVFGWLGLVLIAGGTSAFMAYRRHAPPPQPGDVGSDGLEGEA